MTTDQATQRMPLTTDFGSFFITNPNWYYISSAQVSDEVIPSQSYLLFIF